MKPVLIKKESNDEKEIIETIKEYIKKETGDEIEIYKIFFHHCHNQGIGFHTDKGNHKGFQAMPWCLYSASWIEDTEYKNGSFLFKNPDMIVTREQQLNHILIFDCFTPHSVESVRHGDRLSNVYFFGSKDKAPTEPVRVGPKEYHQHNTDVVGPLDELINLEKEGKLPYKLPKAIPIE